MTEEMLADGTSVNATARAVGYRKPSAFIAAFHRVTGHTPGTYLPQLRQAFWSSAVFGDRRDSEEGRSRNRSHRVEVVSGGSCVMDSVLSTPG